MSFVKNIGTVLLLILIGSCFSQCNSRTHAKEMEFKQQMSDLHVQLKDGLYMIIPIDGCGKCVEKGVAFSLNHLNSSKIYFIITTDSGLKPVRNLYGEQNLGASNLILDSHAKFIRSGFTNGFITLIHVDAGRMRELETLEPQQVEDRLKKLDEMLRPA